MTQDPEPRYRQGYVQGYAQALRDINLVLCAPKASRDSVCDHVEHLYAHLVTALRAWRQDGEAESAVEGRAREVCPPLAAIPKEVRP